MAGTFPGFVAVPVSISCRLGLRGGQCRGNLACLRPRLCGACSTSQTGRRASPRAVAEPPVAPNSSGALDKIATGEVLTAGRPKSRASTSDGAVKSTASEPRARFNAGSPPEVRTSSPTLRSGFRVGQPHTAETRRKIGEANKGKIPWNKGKKHSPETKKRIAEATRRAMNRPETRLRLKEMASGRKHSDETRFKISASSRARTSLLSSTSECSLSLDSIAVSLRRMRRRQKRSPVPFKYAADVLHSMNAKIHQAASQAILRPIITTVRSSSGSLPRRPMPDSTRAKLSARIKEKWTDPAYRERVRSGLKRTLSAGGSQRKSLSEEHKDRIRQTLLRRNDELRKQGLLESSSRRVRERTARRKSGSKIEQLVGEGSESHSDVVNSDSENELLKEKMKRRSAQRRLRLKKELDRTAAKQRAQDRELLDALASAGQLPSLTPGGDHVTGNFFREPVFFGRDGTEVGALDDVFESVRDPHARNGHGRLLFSSSGSSDAVGDAVENSRSSSMNLPVSHVPLDFDIYNPPKTSLDDETDDDDAFELEEARSIPAEDDDILSSSAKLLGEDDVESVISEVLQRSLPEPGVTVEEWDVSGGRRGVESAVDETQADVWGVGRAVDGDDVVLDPVAGDFEVVRSPRSRVLSDEEVKRVVTYRNGKPEGND